MDNRNNNNSNTNQDKYQELKYVYIILTDEGDEGHSRDVLPEHYDAEVIAVCANKRKANRMAKKYFENDVGGADGEYDDYQSELDENGLFNQYHRQLNDGYSDYGGMWTLTRVWVEKQKIINNWQVLII
eukprot:410854_1